MDPNQQAIIHNIHRLQKLRIPPQLFRQQRLFLRAKLEYIAAVDPIKVLQHSSRILHRLVLWILPAHRAPFQVVRLMHILMRREEVVHDHEMDFTSMRELHPMQAIKPAEERMRVLLHMRVVLLQDAEQKLVLRMSNGFDDETVVARKVEKRARFARRAQL